jgi:type III pantothenate kinase
LSTNSSKTADEYGSKILDLLHYAVIDAASVKEVAIASVVPALDPVFEELVASYFKKKAFFITGAVTGGITVKYETPSEVGADRIADAAAAYAFYGGPAVIIDFGTATTFDCVSKKGEYLGGVIAPGPKISAESLALRTAKLPRVEMLKPKKAIATTTVTSIQSGLYFGYVGLIKEILNRIRKEMPGSPRVIATGGLAHLMVPEIKEVRQILPDLTLEGIRIIWEKEQKR